MFTHATAAFTAIRNISPFTSGPAGQVQRHDGAATARALERQHPNPSDLHQHVLTLPHEEQRESMRALVNHSARFRDYLGIRRPPTHRWQKWSPHRNVGPVSKELAPLALAQAAVLLDKASKIERALNRLETSLQELPPGIANRDGFVGGALTCLAQGLPGLRARGHHLIADHAQNLINSHLSSLGETEARRVREALPQTAHAISHPPAARSRAAFTRQLLRAQAPAGPSAAASLPQLTGKSRPHTLASLQNEGFSTGQLRDLRNVLEHLLVARSADEILPTSSPAADFDAQFGDQLGKWTDTRRGEFTRLFREVDGHLRQNISISTAVHVEADLHALQQRGLPLTEIIDFHSVLGRLLDLDRLGVRDDEWDALAERFKTKFKWGSFNTGDVEAYGLLHGEVGQIIAGKKAAMQHVLPIMQKENCSPAEVREFADALDRAARAASYGSEDALLAEQNFNERYGAKWGRFDHERVNDYLAACGQLREYARDEGQRLVGESLGGAVVQLERLPADERARLADIRTRPRVPARVPAPERKVEELRSQSRELRQSYLNAVNACLDALNEGDFEKFKEKSSNFNAVGYDKVYGPITNDTRPRFASLATLLEKQLAGEAGDPPDPR